MSDQDKFQGFKQKLIEKNENQYGKEARVKFGDESVNKSKQKVLNMTREDYDAVTKLNAALMETLAAAYRTGNPSGELAQKAADLHRQWLSFYWPAYSKEAHAGLAQMYVDDERFTAYYDREKPGLAAFLRDAIHFYTGQTK